MNTFEAFLTPMQEGGRLMSLRNTSKWIFLLALVSLGFCVPSVVQADSALVKLGTLLAADNILIGVVTQVDPGPTPDSQQAILTVQENLQGTAPSTITLQGSATDPSLHFFAVGVQLLAFLQATAGGFTLVGGLHGLIEIPPGKLPAARALVVEWINKNAAIRLADMRDDCQVQDAPAPPLLLGSMLEEMTVRLASADFALTAEMACNQAQEFLSAAQLWAILRIGQFKIADARACMEQLLAAEGDLGARLAASETLGNLRDTRSLPVLQAVLASQEGTAEDGKGRAADGGLSQSAVLAIGKLGDPSAVPDLMKLAKEGDDLALHSTAVHALGLIGGNRVIGALTEISKTHSNPLIREQAQETLAAIPKGNNP